MVEKEFARHKDAVYAQMFRMCGNHEDAEDVLVEALMKAHRAADQLAKPEVFRAWIVQIGRRTCSRLKQKGNQLSLVSMEFLSEIPSTDPSPEDTLLEQETKACLLTAIASLDHIQRQVYQLREVDELSTQKVAVLTGLSEAAVKSRLHRARIEVRNSIDRMFDLTT